MKNSLCKSCLLIKDKDTLNTILASPYDREKMESYLFSRGHDAMVTIQDTFDTIANYLYKHDKDLLEHYLFTNKALFSKRVYTHNNTQLCHVVGYMLRRKPDVPMPGCCLMCLAHTLRYTDDEYIGNLILRSVIIRYADGPNVESMVRKANSTALYEFGTAILEKQGQAGVFEEYIGMLTRYNLNSAHTIIALYEHPIFHKAILSINLDCQECRTHRQRIYNIFKGKKDAFFEELMAKSMHPSRVFYWCLEEEDKNDMAIDNKNYSFHEGKASWQFDWNTR